MSFNGPIRRTNVIHGAQTPQALAGVEDAIRTGASRSILNAAAANIARLTWDIAQRDIANHRTKANITSVFTEEGGIVPEVSEILERSLRLAASLQEAATVQLLQQVRQASEPQQPPTEPAQVEGITQ